MAGSNSVSDSASMAEYKRLILIGIQIKNIFDVILTDVSEAVKEEWQKAVEKKHVKSFTFYAMKEGKIYAELEINIDWDEYQRQMDRGNIIIKTKSPNGVLPPTKNVASRFKEYADHNGFYIEWSITFSDNIDILEARKRYNTTPAQHRERAEDYGEFQRREYYADDLTELKYTLKI